MKILICERNAVVAMDLWWALQDLGHTVSGTVSTCRECFETAARIRPELVTVGLSLRDGMTEHLVEALAKIDVPAILLSEKAGLVPPTTSAKAVLEKPFDKDAIASAIAKVKLLA